MVQSLTTMDIVFTYVTLPVLVVVMVFVIKKKKKYDSFIITEIHLNDRLFDFIVIIVIIVCTTYVYDCYLFEVWISLFLTNKKVIMCVSS